MIECVHLTKNYGRFRAVSDVNLTIHDGEVFGFLGLNGAGKTTLMRMIIGLLRPSGGHALIGGVRVCDPEDIPHLTPTVSFLSQEMRFYEQSNLRDLLGLYAVLAQTTREEGLAFARKAGVPLDRPCGKFSPGQQRKAQLAIALLKHPRYLLLDEPTAGLDPQGVAEMREIIRGLHTSGATVFLSTHNLSEIQALCTSVGIIHQGILRYQSRVEEAYTIQIFGDSQQAAARLRDIGVPAVSGIGEVRVGIPQDELPAVIAHLASRMRVGLVQSANLEELFRRVITETERAV
ncbi:MAG: ABC transporter ATP-binding protein [Anaerolineales bacterium]